MNKYQDIILILAMIVGIFGIALVLFGHLWPGLFLIVVGVFVIYAILEVSK